MVAADTALFVFVLCLLNILPVKADDGDMEWQRGLVMRKLSICMNCDKTEERSVQIYTIRKII